MSGVELSACPFCGGAARLWMPEYPLNVDCGDATVSCSNCDADGPSIGLDMDVHTLADWPDLEAEAIAAWNRRAVPMEAVSRAYCQKCGGDVEGWICQSCDQDFRENDAGDLVFDDDAASHPMEAVAWREKVARIVAAGWFDEKDGSIGLVCRYAGSKADYAKADAILQALTVIPAPGNKEDGR